MFLGTHFPKLDDKGRLFLPAKFRDELAEGLVITRGQERSLSVWPEREFVQLTEQLKQAPITNKGARDYLRMLFAGASNELRQAWLVNPYDLNGMKAALMEAYRADGRDLTRRMRAMRKTIAAADVAAWAKAYLEAMEEVRPAHGKHLRPAHGT